MRLPRDLSGNDLAQALRQLGYSIARQAAAIFASLHFNMESTTSQSHNIHRSVSERFRQFLVMSQPILRSVAISSWLSSLSQGSSVKE